MRALLSFWTVLVFNFYFLSNLLAASSSYTSLQEKDCKMLRNSADDPNAPIDYFTMRCPGRDGYEIFVEGGDLRSWLVVKKNGKELFDLRRTKGFFEKAPGSFPYVSGNRLEWRYAGNNKLSALIIRIAGSDGETSKERSILFVIRHQAGQFCFLGASPSNEEAQNLADGSQSCE